MTSEMPGVRDCTMRGCAFNESRICRSETITFSREERPACKTYSSEPGPTRQRAEQAKVGTCAAYMCLHNREPACIAYRVKVGIRGGEPRCLTYKSRYKEATN